MNHISAQDEYELERLLALSNLGVDYYEPKLGLDFLTELAARVSGTEVSLINLIDSFTQWSVSSFGVDVSQMPKEDSVCQYTIQGGPDESFEVRDLSEDERFKDKFYVAGAPNLRYYMGVPLTSPDGYNLGALCVMDSNLMSLSEEVKDILRLIARQVVDRLRVNNLVTKLKEQNKSTELSQKKLAHDIRGPIGGIIGLSNLMLEDKDEVEKEEMLEYVEMIKASGSTLLDLSDEILKRKSDSNKQQTPSPKEGELNLNDLRESILSLMAPQVRVKGVKLKVEVSEENQFEPFSKIYVLQILGNLLSNSIKFTESGGEILLKLELIRKHMDLVLSIEVQDNGLGMSEKQIQDILQGRTASLQGTQGELGYGLGLNLVNQLVQERAGCLSIDSKLGEGSRFRIKLPVN